MQLKTMDNLRLQNQGFTHGSDETTGISCYSNWDFLYMCVFYLGLLAFPVLLQYGRDYVHP